MATYPPLLSRFGIAFLTVFLVCDSVFAQPNKKILEQTSFGAEGSVERPVKLPRSVIELLLEVDNGQLKSCLKEEPDISTHFEASRININVDAYPDLIVKATSLCFRGAHVTAWWLFSNLGTKDGLDYNYELIFSKSADGIDVLSAQTNGFRDLNVSNYSSAGAVQNQDIYKFDGTDYQSRVCSVMYDFNQKPIRIRCHE